MPAPPFSLDSIRVILSTCLDQAQRSISSHRKNHAILYKLFLASSNVTEVLDNGRGVKLVGEKAFVEAVKEMGINRVLTVKRGNAPGDRVVRFVCGFVGHAVEMASKQEQQDDEEGSSAARLTSAILKHLLKGFEAKDKNVRFRSTQFVATLITGLGEIDDADYQSLLSHLLLRIRDRESFIRVQAAVALAKLQNPDELEHLGTSNNDDEDEDGHGVHDGIGRLGLGDSDNEEEDEEDAQGRRNPTKVLVDTMRHDPSAEVRRACLFQLTLSPLTLPYILSRSRDIDPLNRKLLYSSCLSELPGLGVLSPEQRGTIVRYGCGDRDEGVKRAAKGLVGKWAGAADAGPTAILEFAGFFDVVGETKIAEQAINAVFDTRQDLAMQLQFPDAFWTDLSPESALVARLYIAYCKSVNDELRLEACLPVITALAFRIQDLHASLLALHAQITINEDEEIEQEVNEGVLLQFGNVSFVVGQLLEVALLADYGDEIGRRKMFTLIRDMITDPNLPSVLIPGCMDVLLKLSTNERDFQRVVVEIVQNVREDAAASEEVEGQNAENGEEDDEEEEEDDLDLNTATAEEIAEAHRKKLEKAARKLQNQTLDIGKKDHLRCLALVRALLERVAGSLNDNATTMGLVHELIVPSVKSKEPEIRENGLLCLGLCCLLDKNYALDSFGLFVHQSQETTGELQVKIFKIIFDILMLYGVSFLEVKGHAADRVLEFLVHALNQDSMEIQATAAIGIAKLMLSGMVADNEVLKRLVLVYFAPETVDNLELRQCLSYFFPVYCYSLSANQTRMQEIYLPCLEILSVVYEDLDDPSMMVAPAQLANQLLDWTDPQKAVAPEGVAVDESIQVELALDILKEIYKETKKDARKSLCQLLNKLHIPDSLDEWKCKSILLLINQLEMHRPLKDAVSRNALTKFDNSLKKRFPERSAPMDEEDFRALEQLTHTVEFLDNIKIENEERDSADEYEQQEVAKAKRPKAAPRKRAVSKTPSRKSATPSVEPEERPSTARRSARQPQPVAKKQPVIVEEEEEDSEEEPSSEEEESDAAPAAVQAAQDSSEDTDDTM